MKRVPFVAIILENTEDEVLLLLRDTTAITCSKHWTLASGKVGVAETPEMAARRVLKEETGIKTQLSFWKCYEREHPLFLIEQHVYLGKVESSGELPALGRDTQFFKHAEIGHLKIGYGFDALLNEYFLIQER
jgi:8-oxo-dGTP pyrophosphatase MutT (NUDIX family)